MTDKNINNKEMMKLLSIMEQLRASESGCPWDIKQTFETIAPYTIEEAYEVADAIQRNDMEALRAELGDLLFQVVFHSKLAEEQHLFGFNDVVTAICEKLTNRHPHVFAGKKIAEADLAQHWEESKRKERSDTGLIGILNEVNSHQPAMNQAYKLQKKASSVGFDWHSVEPVIQKLDEEIAEIKKEIPIADNQLRIEEELGDVLFSCVNLARHLDVNPEWSLRRANERFTQRFNYIEEQLKRLGVSFENSTPETLDKLWNEAKINCN